jgi:predicted acylesterase/phospholipase RssA
MEFDLVFEGGGAKGLAFAGALLAFEKRGYKTRRVIGTSTGSILACLVAAGFSSAESLAAINERLPDGRSRFASFLHTPTLDDDNLTGNMRYWFKTELDNPAVPNLIEPFVDQIMKGMERRELFRHLVSLLLWGGWYSGDVLLKWLGEKLDENGRDLGSSTLLEFYQRTERDLSVVASDITDQEMLVLNHRTAPECPTVQAVHMSMSCPFAWQEVVWKPEWGSYRGRDLSGHVVVDGGLLSNFPIDLFVSSDEYIDEVMGEGSASENVIGLLLDDNTPVPGAVDLPPHPSLMNRLLERVDLLELMKFRVSGMAETLLSAHDKTIMDAYQNLVCKLPAKGYGVLEFDMPMPRVEAILKAGEETMEAFFNLDPAKYPMPG